MLKSRPVIKLPPIPDELKGNVKLYFEQVHAAIMKQVKDVYVDLYHNNVIANTILDQGGLAVLDAVDLATAQVVNKTADNIAETATKKWAGETGADVTDATNVAAVMYVKVCIDSIDSDTSVAAADGKAAFTIPFFMNGMNLIDVIASVHTKGITGTTDIQIRRRRAGADADMLSTKITIADEFFASDEVIDTTKDDVATGDQIYRDIDAVHSGTAPTGLSVVLTFRKP